MTRHRTSRRFGLRKRERGATIVLVTLSMVALLGMAAVSIDFAVASSERSSLQNATDQAALALAQDCMLNDATKCKASTAAWFVEQNAGTSTTTKTLKNGVEKAPAFVDGKVTVRATKNVKHTFARVLGATASSVQAEATAEWGTVPLVGARLIPMGVSYCDWSANQPVSATTPGNSKIYLWGDHKTKETSCAGTGATAATLYGRKGDPGLFNYYGTGFNNVGKAMIFTRSVWPGVNTNCDFHASMWDLIRDVLDEYALIEFDTCMTDKLAGLGPGSTVMMPIYGVEKKSFIFSGVTYPTRLVIVGFAPFKIESWIDYPSIYVTQPKFSQLKDVSTCGFPLRIGIISFGRACSGVRGRFVRSSEGALFNHFSEYGTHYTNPDTGLSGTAPNLGLAAVKLVK